MPPLDSLIVYFENPLAFARDVLGFEPDDVQARVLDPHVTKLTLCCSRGWGKTVVTAVRAAWQMALRPGSTVLVVSESAEKAAELVYLVRQLLEKAAFTLSPDPLRKNGYRIANGSRILPVANRPGAVRGYHAQLVIVDEAALIGDKMWAAISGTRAATYHDSTIILLSTPGARVGFFYEIWASADPTWTRIHVPATQCPRISPEFLAQMKREMHPDDFAREFMAEFGHSRTMLYREENYLAAISAEIPLFDMITRYAITSHGYLGQRALLQNGQNVPANGFYVGVDLGQSRNASTLCIVEYRLDPTGKHDPMTLAPHYNVSFRLRWLQTFPLETPYTDIADIIADLVQHTELRHRAVIVIDAGGVGRGILDALKRHKLPATIKGVQITQGSQITESGGLINIPKQELLIPLDLLLRKGVLKIAAACPELDLFRRELLGMERVRSGGGRWTYTGKTNGSDDLVMAVGLAVGYACHLHPPPGLWENL